METRMDGSLKLVLVVCLLVAVALLASVDAVAEQQVIEEVLVTAQKRSQSVQDVSASVTALSSDFIAERGITEVMDLRFVVPSVQVGNLIGNTGINIRGVGLNLLINNAAPAVAIHVDGVYQPSAAMGDLAFTDLERIEVLRGPQGTLYGRNANGGAVNFITKSADDEFGGSVQASYASYDEMRLQGVLNLPINDRVKLRAVISSWDRDEGFYDNVVPGQEDVVKGETLSARLKLTAVLTENLELNMTAASVDQDGPVNSYTLHNLPGADTLALNPFLANAVIPLDPWRTSVNDPIDFERDYRFLALRFDWAVGEFDVTSVTGWQEMDDFHLADDDATNLSAFIPTRVYESETFTQEINVSGTVGMADFTAGMFYMDDEYYGLIDYLFPLGFSALPPFSRLVYEQFDLSTRAVAVFADVTWNLTDRLRLITGLRHSVDEIENTQRNFLTFGPAAPIVNCPLATLDNEFEATTPRVGLQFDLSENQTAYATYSEGFKDGGFNRTSCQQQYEPEEIEAYEVGIKTRLLNGTATVNAAAFYYDYSDLQLNQQVGLGQLITNAAKADIKGFELEGSWQPDDHWTVNGSVTLLNAKYNQFLNSDPLAGALGIQDVSGNYLNDAPKRSANLGVSYRTGELGIGSFAVQLDASYRSDYYFREFNLPLDRQNSYTVANASIVWDSSDETYRIRAFGRNLTDEGYISAMSSSQALGARYITWGAPRQYGVEFRINL